MATALVAGMSTNIQDAYVTTLDAEYLAAVKESLDEDDNLRNETVQTMRQWISQQPHLNCRTDAYFLVTFARGCKYNLEEMKNKLEMFLTLKTCMPEFFTGWDPMRPEVQSALQVGMELPVPGYDVHGRKVIIIRLGCFDPASHKPEDLEKANFMVMECLYKNEERATVGGVITIFDMEGVTRFHLLHKPFNLLKKHMKFIQEAVAFPPQAIFFIRTSTMFSAGFTAMQSMFNEIMKQRIQVLGHDLEKLQKIIPKSSLPSDYGGDGMSLAELAAYWKKQVENEREFLMTQEQYRCDESKRPAKPKPMLFGLIKR